MYQIGKGSFLRLLFTSKPLAFERNEGQIKKLEEQLETQEELNKAIEMSLANKAMMRQQEHNLEEQL